MKRKQKVLLIVGGAALIYYFWQKQNTGSSNIFSTPTGFNPNLAQPQVMTGGGWHGNMFVN